MKSHIKAILLTIPVLLAVLMTARGDFQAPAPTPHVVEISNYANDGVVLDYFMNTGEVTVDGDRWRSMPEVDKMQLINTYQAEQDSLDNVHPQPDLLVMILVPDAG